MGLGGWVGTFVPVCPQAAEPLQVLLIYVARKTHPETGGSVPRGCPTGVNRSWGQQTELGLLLPPGMLGSRTVMPLRNTPGYGIPPSLLSSAVFSEVGIRARPQHPGDTFYPAPQSPCVSCSFRLQYLSSLSTAWLETSCGACPHCSAQGTAHCGKGSGKEVYPE